MLKDWTHFLNEIIPDKTSLFPLNRSAKLIRCVKSIWKTERHELGHVIKHQRSRNYLMQCRFRGNKVFQLDIVRSTEGSKIPANVIGTKIWTLILLQRQWSPGKQFSNFLCDKFSFLRLNRHILTNSDSYKVSVFLVRKTSCNLHSPTTYYLPINSGSGFFSDNSSEKDSFESLDELKAE